MTQKFKFMLEGVENIVGKEEMLVTSISSFPTIFSKLFFQIAIKKLGLCGKGQTLWHAILTFNGPDKESFGKHCGNKRTMMVLYRSPKYQAAQVYNKDKYQIRRFKAKLQ